MAVIVCRRDTKVGMVFAQARIVMKQLESGFAI